jgi:hypothetical protein
MTMQRRVGFTLTQAQIERACAAYVASRLLPDEEAKAAMKLITTNGVNGELTEADVCCEITVSKKRVRKPKKNGAQV